jgi:hypothetical protein
MLPQRGITHTAYPQLMSRSWTSESRRFRACRDPGRPGEMRIKAPDDDVHCHRPENRRNRAEDGSGETAKAARLRVGRSHAWRWSDDHGFGKRWPRPAGFGAATPPHPEPTHLTPRPRDTHSVRGGGAPGAASRFDDRRQLIVQEVNAIGTAWLRIDMLPPEARSPIQDGFRRYLDARLAAYRKLPDIAAAKQELANARRIQEEVWAKATDVCRTEAGAPARILLIPAMNEMFDIAEARTLATRAGAARAGRRAARWLQYGGRADPQLDPHGGLRGYDRARNLRHSGIRVPAPRIHPA